jgi:tetratricopeptide (TPR) repeat protein
MSLINEALKKAEGETGDDGTPENAYPQKIFFLAGRQSSHHLLRMVLGALVLGGLAVAALQMPSVTQRLFRFSGLPAVPMSKPRLPAPAPARGRQTTPPATHNASKTLTEPRAQIDQLIKTGQVALEADNLAAARSAFARAIQSDSTSAAAQNGLGLVEKRAGKLADAERHYLEAIRLNPKYAETHNNLALLYDQQGKADRAVVEYTTALSLRPDYPEAHLNYAIALERLGRTADARVEYEKFLANVPFELHDVAEQVHAHVASLL